ncbi:MAG: hypothetical protein B7C54_09825 [Acidimicrobiales bacterium mtb01]|nr:DUF2256 and DUF3253 domain-containing protein [Actinomycetota bacterium]TEX45980.1 MAG: hypothetical protein B7C54_09825 [Acidimicrobiales bacterium mtb01]
MPADGTAREHKICASCGRRMEWRKKWELNWDSVKYCSDRCRRTRISDLDRRLETRIEEMLANRSGTMCPSEVARAESDEWRDLMEPVRAAARRLAARGFLVFTQGGRVVDPSTAKGPIRLRRT